ncbi:hypothetical protein COL37_31665, partial [Bacillus toyonensis]
FCKCGTTLLLRFSITRIVIFNMTSAYNRGLQQSLKGSDLLKHVANRQREQNNKHSSPSVCN